MEKWNHLYKVHVSLNYFIFVFYTFNDHLKIVAYVF